MLQASASRFQTSFSGTNKLHGIEPLNQHQQSPYQPAHRRDIETRADIEQFIETFYSGLLSDPLLRPIFTDVAHVDLAKHITVICDFWENILFDARKYTGGMMMVHMMLQQKIALKPYHFERWLAYFNDAVDQSFEGDRATLAKTHAYRVATMMATRFEQIPGGPLVTPEPSAFSVEQQ
jgi:truncated hemoglobin YjbI